MRFLTQLSALAVVFAVSLPAFAQDETFEEIPDDNGYFSLTPDLNLDENYSDVETVEQPKATTAPGAVLRGLDKVGGTLADIELANGETVEFGRLIVKLGECRYPSGNPSGDAYAYLEISRDPAENPIFAGWMIASSPALNALDHSRYDIWVIRCKTS